MHVVAGISSSEPSTMLHPCEVKYSLVLSYPVLFPVSLPSVARLIRFMMMKPFHQSLSPKLEMGVCIYG